MSPHRNRALMIAYFVFLAAVIFSALIANAAQSFLDEIFGTIHPAAFYLFIAVAFAVPLFFLFRFGLENADKILGSTARMTTIELESPRKFLLMGYSPMQEANITQAIEDAQQFPLEIIASNSDDYAAYLKERGLTRPQNFWQQNVRAAFVHRTRLERILVLNPDQNQFESFNTYMRTCFQVERPNLKIDIISIPKDEHRPFQTVDRHGQYEQPHYEDYDYVYEGLQQGLHAIRKSSGSADFEDEVCIDATPGFKPFSIAAAIVTLNRKVKFSYVTTKGRVKFYDAHISLAPQ
jgi:hypothetical protein